MDTRLTVQQYADQCGVDPKTVRAWIRQGKIPDAVKFGRDWGIPADASRPTDRRYVDNPIRNRRKDTTMAKLTMRDVLSKDGYDDLAPAERRRILKVEQAKEYSGWGNYPDTCAAIMAHLPADVWERYTAQQIGEIMQIIHNAYIAGRKAVDGDAQ